MVRLASTAALSALALTLTMCAGTETDNPVLDFDASDCSGPMRTQSALSAVAGTSASLTLDPASYNGLYCYAWQAHGDGTVTIDVLNFDGACGATYVLSETRVQADHVDLGIANEQCLVNKCDTTCLYDFTFTLSGVDTSGPVHVSLRDDGCTGGAPDVVDPEVVLPLDVQDEGVICRQDIYRGGPPTCGLPRTPPCGGQYFGTCGDGCGADLACVEDALGDEDMCFSVCEADGDCPLEIEACEDGACRLRETF